MALSAGTRLGQYEIVGLIGTGGMGDVYKARDTRLDRPVAIKVSKDALSERFEREARAIAALNHPHICQLYDVGPNYLVMELIEGKPLKGPMPVEKALRFARQILDALDTAHRKGIVHRDLKPANILSSKTGVKLLDFGLAKATPAADSDAATISRARTAEGTILGTLQYMSPEQVQGHNADERSDIFAFGLVLHEMITGKCVFEGTSQASLIAAILKDQPTSLSELQPLAPKTLDRIVETCLEKDPERRWQSARELSHALEWVSTEAPSSARPIGKQWFWKTAVAVLAAIGAVVIWTPWRDAAPPTLTIRFQVPLPQNQAFGGRMAVSPDGRRLAFNTPGPNGGLWVRDLDSPEPRLLPGTQNAVQLFWSPDSRFLGFSAGNQLKKIDVSGGSPVTLVDMPCAAGSGAWNQNDVIIFSCIGNGPLHRISGAGGSAIPVTRLDSPIGDEFHAIPSFLPDQRHFIYYRTSAQQGKTGMYVGSLDATPEEQGNKQIRAGGLAASYADGRLFFVRDGSLLSQPLDTERLELTGEPVPIAEEVGNSGAGAWFSVSQSGVLAYRTGPPPIQQLTWLDRQGRFLATVGEPGPYMAVTLSPNGMRAAILHTGDIWLWDLARGVNTRFTFDRSVITGNNNGSRGTTRYMAFAWSPDGSRIVFLSNRARAPGIYEKDSSGAGDEQLVVKSARPSNWSRDGRFLLYQAIGEKTLTDIWVLPRHADGRPFPWLRTEFQEAQGTFSPDGRWIAYASNESGRSSDQYPSSSAPSRPLFGAVSGN